MRRCRVRSFSVSETELLGRLLGFSLICNGLLRLCDDAAGVLFVSEADLLGWLLGFLICIVLLSLCDDAAGVLFCFRNGFVGGAAWLFEV